MKKVVKFGGSSLASAEQFKKVASIILAEESRRYVVPSAPGKRFDSKSLDQLVKAFSWKWYCIEMAVCYNKNSFLKEGVRFAVQAICPYGRVHLESDAALRPAGIPGQCVPAAIQCLRCLVRRQLHR